MAVPTRSTFHRPILEIARDAEDGARLSTAQFLGELTDRLSLTEADLQERLDSGASRVKNHVGRALSSLTRAGLLDRPSPGQYQIAEKGLSFIHGREGRIGHSLLIRMIAKRQQHQPGDTGLSPEGGPIAGVSGNGDDTEKWLRKSEQGDKWNRCLIEGMIVLSETGARDEQTTPP